MNLEVFPASFTFKPLETIHDFLQNFWSITIIVYILSKVWSSQNNVWYM
jgi:hypothetical protein